MNDKTDNFLSWPEFTSKLILPFSDQLYIKFRSTLLQKLMSAYNNTSWYFHITYQKLVKEMAMKKKLFL